jgi:tetratricopeptide (TPR) repeat protein
MGNFAAMPALRPLFLFSLLIASAAIIWQASVLWLADARLESGAADKMRKGAALVPGDAEAWDRLGRYYLLSFSDPNTPVAVADFQRAVQIDPLSEDYWMDLASADDALGDEAGAGAAYEKARAVYPSSAQVAWNYGNFLLREGKDDEAYQQISRAVKGTPTLLPLAMSRAWHSSGDVNQLLDRVIPADTNSYLTALNFFASMHEMQAGLVVWQRLVALRQPLRPGATFNFIEELIREDDSADALRVWNDAVTAGGDTQLAVSGASVVSDGEFQTDFPNGGLGWRWQPELGTSIDFDASTPDGKGRSVRLDFSGGVNSNVVDPSQYVAVQPGETYHFHAAIRTEEITTDSGPRFTVSDPSHGGLNVQSQGFVGTQAWTNVDLNVTTWPQTHFLEIQLTREPSKFFDNKLGGTVWITDVSLEPANGEPDQSGRLPAGQSPQ